MPAAPRIDPKTIFTPEEWAQLSARSYWMGPALVLAAWGVIGAAMAMFILWPNPATYLLAVMLIGARQLGLAILMHEAAHGTLHPNQAFNDWMGEWLCAAPTGASLARYRPYHLKHHKYTEQPEDPDLILSRPFPITRKSFMRKAIRDLTGQTFFKLRVAPTMARWFGPKRGENGWGMERAAIRFWVVNLTLFAILAGLGYWWAYFALWVVPNATWLFFITRLRNIAEHACLSQPDDPFQHARTTHANIIERLFIAPFWVHFHAEHHLFMHISCWNLPKAHRMLVAKGYGDRMEIKPSYLAVLRVAAGKPAAA